MKYLFTTPTTLKSKLFAILAVGVLAGPVAAQAATHRLTVEGLIIQRSEYTGLPLPVIGSVGTSYAIHWDIDDSVVPTTSAGQYIWWRGPIDSFGFVTPGSSGIYSDNSGTSSYVYVATESTRSYYNLQGHAREITPSYSYGAYMLLNGPSGLALEDVGQLDPRPLSQWAGAEGNYALFSTCPTAGGGCSATVGSVVSIRYELLSGPDTLLEQLATAVTGVGPGKSLADKIMLAQTYLAVPDVQSTCAILNDFLNQVRAQRGKKLTIEVADQLTADAQAIMDAIGCN